MAVVSSCRESRDPGERSPGKIQLTTVKPLLQGTAFARGTKGRRGNTVGSPATSILYHQTTFLPMSKPPHTKTHPLIVGTILGDGSLNRYGCLTVEHGTRQEEYVRWKYGKMKALRMLTKTSTPRPVKRLDKRSGTRHFSLRFNTRSIFKAERELFYPLGGKKKLPLQLEDLITPYALAVWFMDDGGQGGNSTYGLVIDVSNYTPPERAFLQQLLRRKYHLTTSLQHGTGSSAKLFVRKVSAFAFYKLVTPYLHQSMRYKVAAFEALPLPVSIAMALGGNGNSLPIPTTRDPLYLLMKIVGCLSCSHEQGKE